MGNGLLSQVSDWFTHPMYSDGTMLEWGAGLIGILILAFLWSLVIKEFE